MGVTPCGSTLARLRKLSLASTLEYNVPRSTLSDRLRGTPPRNEVQKNKQALSPAVE